MDLVGIICIDRSRNELCVSCGLRCFSFPQRNTFKIRTIKRHSLRCAVFFSLCWLSVGRSFGSLSLCVRATGFVLTENPAHTTKRQHFASCAPYSLCVCVTQNGKKAGGRAVVGWRQHVRGAVQQFPSIYCELSGFFDMYTCVRTCLPAACACNAGVYHYAFVQRTRIDRTMWRRKSRWHWHWHWRLVPRRANICVYCIHMQNKSCASAAPMAPPHAEQFDS